MSKKLFKVTFTNDEDGGELKRFDTYKEAAAFAKKAKGEEPADIVRVERGNKILVELA